MAKMKIGIVDTMFARVDMAGFAIEEIKKSGMEFERRTVPGVKDLAVECKRLLDSGCGTCMALGMVGGAPIDTQCAHEASLGIMQAKLLTGKHIVEVFVHENEAWSEAEFHSICENRTRKHAQNTIMLATNPGEMGKYAGMGVRQGKEDEGRIAPGKREKTAIAIVVSEFNKKIANAMLGSALDEAKKRGVEVRTVLRVPGAFEIPLGVEKALGDKGVRGVATLGYVKKGKTMHDRVISSVMAESLMRISLGRKRPVSLGVIMVADEEGAAERSEDYARRSVRAVAEMVEKLKV